MRFHSHIDQYGGADDHVLQVEPWTDTHPAPWLDGNDALRDVYEVNRPLILQDHRHEGMSIILFMLPLFFFFLDICQLG